MLFMETSVLVETCVRNKTTDWLDKMLSYFYYISYQASHIYK